MLFPVRCFSCNACLPSDSYEHMRKQGLESKQALNSLGVERMCCRRMMMSHPHALEGSLLDYPNVDKSEPELFLDIRCHTSEARQVGCD